MPTYAADVTRTHFPKRFSDYAHPNCYAHTRHREL